MEQGEKKQDNRMHIVIKAEEELLERKGKCVRKWEQGREEEGEAMRNHVEMT